jgi:hypothetical protein
MLIGSFSALYFITAIDDFFRFLNIYLMITLPFVVLQALGIFDIVHSWNTILPVCDELLNCEESVSIVNVIGMDFDAVVMKAGQYRPPGLFHSQAMLGALVAFALILNIYSNFKRKSKGLIIIILLVVFGMSKVVQIQLLMIVSLIMFQFGIAGMSKALQIILIWISVLMFYNFLVPGLASYQLNLDQYVFAAGSRLLDFYSSLNQFDGPTVNEYKKVIREATDVGVYVTSEANRGKLSGLNQLFWVSPVLFLLILKVKTVYKKNMGNNLFLKNKLPWEMYIAFLLVTVTQIMVTNTFGTQFVMFFWGVLVTPLYCNKSKLLTNFRYYYKTRFTW